MDTLYRSWIADGIGVGLALAMMAGTARADLITPTTAFASTYYSSSQNPANLITNTGLDTSSGNVLTYVQAPNASAETMWHAGAGQGIGGAAPVVANQYLVFDLGANYDLSLAYLWQMVQPGLLGRGIMEFQLYASPDAPSSADRTNPPAVYDISGFTNILSSSTLAISAPTGATTQSFTLTGATNVRQIYLDIGSAWSGQANDYVGLSKIRFEGTLLDGIDYHWVAGSGAWQTTTSWSPAGTPGGNDRVIFDNNGTYVVSSTANVSANVADFLAGKVFWSPLNSVTTEIGTINLTGGKLDATTLWGGVPEGGMVGFKELNITEGGQLTSFSVMIGWRNAVASAEVDGAGSLLAGSYVSVGAGGTGTLAITDGGRVTSANGFDIGGQSVGGGIGNGEVTVDGTGSLLEITGNLEVGYGNNLNEGRLSILNGGQVTSSADVEIGAVSAKGSVTVGKSDGSDTGGSKISAANLYVGRYASAGATLNVNQGGAVEVTGIFGAVPSVLFGTIEINLAGGWIKAHDLDVRNAAYWNWTGGTLWLTGGTGWIGATVDAALEIPLDGTLKGAGLINGVITNRGTIAPGDEEGPGHFAFARPLTLTSTSVVEMDLFSASLFDTLEVTGMLTYGGILQINLLEGYTPDDGAQFHLFDFSAGQYTGVFDEINLSHSGYTATFDYGTGILTFAVIPEPGSSSLLLLGGLAALFQCRRKRPSHRHSPTPAK